MCVIVTARKMRTSKFPIPQEFFFFSPKCGKDYVLGFYHLETI